MSLLLFLGKVLMECCDCLSCRDDSVLKVGGDGDSPVLTLSHTMI